MTESTFPLPDDDIRTIHRAQKDILQIVHYREGLTIPEIIDRLESRCPLPYIAFYGLLNDRYIHLGDDLTVSFA